MQGTLTIQSETGKGRTFSGTILAYATADGLWDGGHSKGLRPVYLELACSEQEAKPLLANLQIGRKAKVTGGDFTSKGEKLELLKSAGYVIPPPQRVRAGVVITAYLAPLFIFDPGVSDAGSVAFVLLPDLKQLEREAARFDGKAIMRHVRKSLELAPKLTDGWGKPKDYELTALEQRSATLPAMAALFCGALHRRAHVPQLPDPRFQAQLYVEMLRRGLASWSAKRGDQDKFGRHPHLGFYQASHDMLAPGVACRATHDAIRDVMVDTIRKYEDITRKAGK